MRKHLLPFWPMLYGLALFCALAAFGSILFAQSSSRGLAYHYVQVYNEEGREVTDITSVTIYAPGTTNTPKVYKDWGHDNEITIPMTTGSTNTTLSNGAFYWYGRDGFDLAVTSTSLGITTFKGLTASSGRVTVPKYLSQLSSMGTVTVEISNDDVNSLQATPKVLLAAPGAGKVIVPMSAILILDYGTNAYTETADNLAIGWDSASFVQAGDTIEVTGFIDQTADTITTWHMAKDEIDAAASIANKNLCLSNIGDGEFGGNAADDSTMTVIVTYQILETGL